MRRTVLTAAGPRHRCARLLAPVVLGVLAAMPLMAVTISERPWTVRPAQGVYGVDAEPLRRKIESALRRGAFVDAADLIDEYLDAVPNDALMLYNAACLSARAGELDTADVRLREAVRAGFAEVSVMQRDPDLREIRDRPIFRAMVSAREAADPILFERRVNEWRDRLGDPYVFTEDDERRLTCASDLSDDDHDDLTRLVGREADLLAEIFGPLRHRVLVTVVDQRDADWSGANIHGRYLHQTRQALVLDAGTSLRHELVHAFHHHDMDARGQRHPFWIQEGVAALFEAYIVEEGRVRPLANDRDVTVQRLAETGSLMSWSSLFRLSRQEFLAAPAVTYAQARLVFVYLAERDLLSAWYRAYVDGYDEDVTGRQAMESVFGRSLGEIEKDWRAWAQSRSVEGAVASGDDLEMRADRHGGPLPPRVVTEEDLLRAEIQAAFTAVETEYAEGRYRTAITGARQILELDPAHAGAHYTLGLAYFRTQDLGAARTHCTILRELDPSLSSLLQNLVGHPAP